MNEEKLQDSYEDTLYNGVQVVKILNEDMIMVGRWNGIMEVFQYTKEKPKFRLKKYFCSTEMVGVQAISKEFGENKDFFITSATSSSIFLYKISKKKEVTRLEKIKYEKECGVANSTCVIDNNLILTGHSNGFVIVWKLEKNTLKLEKETLKLDKVIKVRSKQPVFCIYNIRQIQKLSKDHIITASEDGNISIVDINKKEIKSTLRYSQKATRGINDISYKNGYLILGNCIGENDPEKFNLWLFKIEETKIIPLDRLFLRKDQNMNVVYTFNVELFKYKDKLKWIASTQEGLIYSGTIINEKLIKDIKVIDCMSKKAEALFVKNDHIVAAGENIRMISLVDVKK